LSYGESEGWSECAAARRRRTALSVKLRLASHCFLAVWLPAVIPVCWTLF